MTQSRNVYMSYHEICHPFLDGYSKCNFSSFPMQCCSERCHNRNPKKLRELLQENVLSLTDIEEIISTSIMYHCVANLYVILGMGPENLTKDSTFVYIFRDLIHHGEWSILKRLLGDKEVVMTQDQIMECIEITVTLYRPKVLTALLQRCIPLRWPKETLDRIHGLNFRYLGDTAIRYLKMIELFHRNLDMGGAWDRYLFEPPNGKRYIEAKMRFDEQHLV